MLCALLEKIMYEFIARLRGRASLILQHLGAGDVFKNEKNIKKQKAIN